MAFFDTPTGILDPRALALLSAAAAGMKASGPSLTPTSFGQVFGDATAQGIGTLQQAQQSNMQQQLFGLKMAEAKRVESERAKTQAALQALSNDPRFAGLGPLLQVAPQAAIDRALPKPLERPIVAAPGSNVLDPKDPSKVLHTVPEREDETSRVLKAAGVTPGTPQWQAAMNARAAKLTTHPPAVDVKVNAFTPASEEAQRDFMKGLRARYDTLTTAPVTLENIERAKALIPGAAGFMGTGGETLLEAAKFLNNRLGMSINTEGIKSAEELRTRIFFQIMDNLKKLDAQPSQLQQQIMMESLGKLGTDPNALPAILDSYAEVIRGKVTQHNLEAEEAVKRGVKFPYDPVIKLRSQKPAAEAGPQTPKIYPQPSREAINRLRMNPKEKEMFEAVFGPGSAAKHGR